MPVRLSPRVHSRRRLRLGNGLRHGWQPRRRSGSRGTGLHLAGSRGRGLRNVFGTGLHSRGGSGRHHAGSRSKSSGRPRFAAGDTGKPATKRGASRRQCGGCGGRSSRRRRRCRHCCFLTSICSSIRGRRGLATRPLRREPRKEPIPKPRPLAAKARRPARAAGHGEAAAPPRRLRSLQGPERTMPHPVPLPASFPVPLPGWQRGRRALQPLARRWPVPPQKQAPTGWPLLP